MKSGKGWTEDIRGTVGLTESLRIVGRGEEESKRNTLPLSLPMPRSVSSSEFSEARRQDRGGRGGSEEEEGVKGDERGRRMKSRGQRFVTDVQNFGG